MKNVLRVLLVVWVAGLAVGQTAPLAPEPPIRPEEALPTIPWQEAGAYLGREVFLLGKVEQSSRARTGHAFLNFDTKRGSSVVIFISKDSYDRFPEPPEKAYRGKFIRVRGFVTEFKGAPQIAVGKPESIEVLPESTPLPTVSSRPSVRPAASGDTITIGSYNVLNLFDSVDDAYTQDEGTAPKPRDEIEALARSIRNLRADVLVLAEVENRGVLRQFVDAFLSDMGYEVVLFEGNDTRGIDVAVLSRLPVGNVTSHRHLQFEDARGKPMRYQRDLLQVQIRPTGREPFEVFAVHLKSKGGDDDGGIDVRMGEARQTRRILDELLQRRPDARFVVCGDFNDTIDSEPLRTIIGTGPTALATFVSDLSPDETITYNQPPHLSMIDFILASPTMAQSYVADSYHVMVGGSPKTTGSDHNAVVARFRLN